MCADAGLMDEKLLRRCVIYYSTVAQYLLKLVETDGRCVRLPSHPPPSSSTVLPLYDVWYMYVALVTVV